MYFQNEPSANPLRLLVNSRVGGLMLVNLKNISEQQQQWSQPPCDWTGKDKMAFLEISAIPQQSNS